MNNIWPHIIKDVDLYKTILLDLLELQKARDNLKNNRRLFEGSDEIDQLQELIDDLQVEAATLINRKFVVTNKGITVVKKERFLEEKTEFNNNHQISYKRLKAKKKSSKILRTPRVCKRKAGSHFVEDIKYEPMKIKKTVSFSESSENIPKIKARKKMRISSKFRSLFSSSLFSCA